MITSCPKGMYFLWRREVIKHWRSPQHWNLHNIKIRMHVVRYLSFHTHCTVVRMIWWVPTTQQCFPNTIWFLWRKELRGPNNAFPNTIWFLWRKELRGRWHSLGTLQHSPQPQHCGRHHVVRFFSFHTQGTVVCISGENEFLLQPKQFFCSKLLDHAVTVH
jgi:hypothetical protein